MLVELQQRRNAEQEHFRTRKTFEDFLNGGKSENFRRWMDLKRIYTWSREEELTHGSEKFTLRVFAQSQSPSLSKATLGITVTTPDGIQAETTLYESEFYKTLSPSELYEDLTRLSDIEKVVRDFNRGPNIKTL